MYQEEDYLMLSGIQHFAFCRRQWALIHIEQQWADNYQTTSGELMHKNAHNETLFEKRGSTLTVRGLKIASRELGLSGQCDVVEFHEVECGIKLHGYSENWKIVPVEYKRGKPKDGPEDELQLCAQAICLEEQFLTEIENGYLYYGENRRRTEVKFTDDMRRQVKQMTMEMHQYFQRGYTPKAKEEKKCKACSLADLCLPGLQKLTTVSNYLNSHMEEV